MILWVMSSVAQTRRNIYNSDIRKKYGFCLLKWVREIKNLIVFFGLLIIGHNLWYATQLPVFTIKAVLVLCKNLRSKTTGKYLQSHFENLSRNFFLKRFELWCWRIAKFDVLLFLFKILFSLYCFKVHFYENLNSASI